MSEATRARFAAAAEPEWSDREAVIDYIVYLERVCSSGSPPFDEADIRAVAGRAFDRTDDIASFMTNHHVIDEGERWRERLGELRVPTLVIHGTEDPLLPYANGLALAREIPSAELVTLENTGHEVPREDWDVVVPALLRHTSGG